MAVQILAKCDICGKDMNVIQDKRYKIMMGVGNFISDDVDFKTNIDCCSDCYMTFSSLVFNEKANLTPVIDAVTKPVIPYLKKDNEPFKWTDEAEDLMWQMKAEGKTYDEIAEVLGTTRGSINGKISRANEKTGKDCRTNKRWTNDEKNKIKSLYLSGKTYSEIADVFGVSLAAINSFLSREVKAGRLKRREEHQKDVENERNERLRQQVEKAQSKARLIGVEVDNNGFVQKLVKPHGKSKENAQQVLDATGIKGTVVNFNYGKIHFDDENGNHRAMTWEGELVK